MSIAHTQPQTNSRAVGGEASPAAPSRGVSHLPQVNPATIAAIARSLEQAKAKAKKKAKKHSKRYTQYKQTAMFVSLLMRGGRIGDRWDESIVFQQSNIIVRGDCSKYMPQYIHEYVLAVKDINQKGQKEQIMSPAIKLAKGMI